MGYLPYGGFLKWWYPTTVGFPTKNDYFGVFWGYHHFRKHPYQLVSWTRISERTINRVTSGPDPPLRGEYWSVEPRNPWSQSRGKKNRGCSINMTQEAPKKALKFEGENKIPQKTTYHTNLQLFLNMSPKNGIPWKMICAKSRQNKQKCLYTFIQSYHFGCFFSNNGHQKTTII